MPGLPAGAAHLLTCPLPRRSAAQAKELLRVQLEGLARSSGLEGWAEIELKTFGSTVTGLGFRSGDMDLVCVIDSFAEVRPEHRHPRRPGDGGDGGGDGGGGGRLVGKRFQAAVLETLAAVLNRSGLVTVTGYIPTARVPILKCTAVGTCIEIDICVNHEVHLWQHATV